MLPSDPGKQPRMEEFLRKSLLGDDLINTQFHLFSSRSSPPGRVAKPRALCANNVLLAKSSNYFVDLLSSDVSPSDSSLSDLADDNDVPNDLGADEYGYGSDSDLDDEEEGPSIPAVAGTKPPRDQPAPGSMFPSGANLRPQPKDEDRSSDNDSDSDSSDIFVMSPEHPKMDMPSVLSLGGTGSVASSETGVQHTPGNKTSANPARLRSMGRRHILVKDTAFQTWYALLNYLYTGKFGFLPLCSTAPEGQIYQSSITPLDEPKCSAKSMYRLACKVGMDGLRDEALAHIRNNLSEHNIVTELSCSLLSKHPELLEMELDVLYTHIASPPVVSGFSLLAQRIALKGLPHGADIIVGIHTRMLRERRWFPARPGSLRRPAAEVSLTEPSPPVTCRASSASVQSEPESKQTAVGFGPPIPLPGPTDYGTSVSKTKSTSGSLFPPPPPKGEFSEDEESEPTTVGFGSSIPLSGSMVFDTPVGKAKSWKQLFSTTVEEEPDDVQESKPITVPVDFDSCTTTSETRINGRILSPPPPKMEFNEDKSPLTSVWGATSGKNSGKSGSPASVGRRGKKPVRINPVPRNLDESRVVDPLEPETIQVSVP